MKFFLQSLLIINFLLPNIYSQNSDSFIASIQIGNDRLNNQFESLNLPIVFCNDNQLVTILDSKKLEILKKIGADYSVIDGFNPGDKLFIVSSKKNDNVSSKLIGQHIVFEHMNSAIVKNLSLRSDNILRSGLTSVELRMYQTFKNEKKIQYRNYSLTTDSLISEITSSVNPDSVRYFIQSLQNFQTRFLLASTRDAVADWIKTQFLQMGFTDVVIDSFLYQGTWQKNVIATLQGIYEPDIINIVGGHHDSYSSGNPMVFAPGADDNASGTAAVLEIARVIMSNNYQSESTIKFITFGAEEYGLWGSLDYAQKALNSGMNIKIMINHDMISHTYSPANQSNVDINRYSGFEYLRDLAFNCIENYSVLTPSNGSLNSSGSDSYSFWELGFPSVYFEESDFSPFYHSPGDTIGNYNMDYCAEVIKSSCATLLTNIVVPSMIQNYKLEDSGTGNSLFLSWSPNQSPDFDHYKVYLGTSSGVYTLTFSTTDTVFTIGNLMEGNLYYVGVSVLDFDGYESLITERSAIPLLLPRAPEGFSAEPQWHQVELKWHRNSERDILGYNIYRSEIEGESGNIINTSVYVDTLLVDNTAQNGIYYYYSVAAVDSQLNESAKSEALRSRVVSLDKGILVVDETFDGDGTPMNPTDAQVDEFYEYSLTHLVTDDFDLAQNGSIELADLGAYSTIIWHGNDFQDYTAAYLYKESIKEYLDYGGNFLYTGYRPARAFENMSGNPIVFGSGSFIYDYLKIDSAFYRIASRFIGAVSKSSGYNSIFVDSSKTPLVDDYHLRFIESISSNSVGIEIYSYETYFDSSSTQGNLKGKPVGVEYLGSDFKTVTLSFPLYYMEKERARELLQFIMINKFNEVLSVDDETEAAPSAFYLDQNYPNPFNPSTIISYHLPVSSDVTLKVYDLLGNEIATLVDEHKPAGKYRVEFTSRTLSSGVYFYQLIASNTSAQMGQSLIQTKKMLLIK